MRARIFEKQNRLQMSQVFPFPCIEDQMDLLLKDSISGTEGTIKLPDSQTGNLNRYVRSEQRGKKPTGRGPEGCDENGPAAASLVSYVSIQICALLAPVRLGPPCRRPILITTKDMLISGTGH